MGGQELPWTHSHNDDYAYTGGYSGDNYDNDGFYGEERLGETGGLESERSRRSFVPCTRQHFDLGTNFTPHYSVGSALSHASTVGRNGFARNSNGESPTLTPTLTPTPSQSLYSHMVASEGNFYKNKSEAPSLSMTYHDMVSSGRDFTGL